MIPSVGLYCCIFHRENCELKAHFDLLGIANFLSFGLELDIDLLIHFTRPSADSSRCA